MAQTIIPAPYGDMTIGWWRQPNPLARLGAIPVVVATTCGHTLAGEDVGRGFVIPAVDRTHCDECDESGAGWVSNGPRPGIPTVVSTVCRHPLSGWATTIGPTTVTAAAIPPLCPDCRDFGEVVRRMADCYLEWESNADFDRSGAAFDKDSEEYEEYSSNKSNARSLYNRYSEERFLYDEWVFYNEKYHPDLPPVSARGVTLLPPVGSTTPTKRVTFADNQGFPFRDTARASGRFWRSVRNPGYQAGRYADTTGRGFEDTSQPLLYTDPRSSSARPSRSASTIENRPKSAMRRGRSKTRNASTPGTTEEQQEAHAQSPFTVEYFTARSTQSPGQGSQSWTMPESEK